MDALLTAEQMRAIEQAAIDSGAVTGLELMERAGRGVVQAILEEWPGIEAGEGPAPRAPRSISGTTMKAVVLCGPGNNGGDGFVVARLLTERGWDVEVFLYGDAGRLPPDAKANYDRWCAMGTVQAFDHEKTAAAEQSASLIIDALFGTGLTRGLSGSLLQWARDRTCWADVIARTVSVDIPSGVCADSGREFGEDGETVLAALTVSFHSGKAGHHLSWGSEKCGALRIKDIGLSDVARPALQDKYGDRRLGRYILSQISAERLHPGLAKGAGHKFTHGHALIVSGPAGRTGAARLAARGALRIGAGVVTVASPPEAMAENAAQLTAIMLQPVGDQQAFEALLADRRINALCLGPALGVDARAAALVWAALKSGRALVLDADALTLIAADQALFDQLHANCVLTPHAGEFARLFPDLAEKLSTPAETGPAFSKADATRAASARAGCTVLFKGPDTVIADQTGACAINSAQYERAAPWLATAGSGDVLAGVITGLMARGLGPKAAAEAAAWLHTEAALRFGPGLIAEDLSEQLPAVFRALFTRQDQ